MTNVDQVPEATTTSSAQNNRRQHKAAASTGDAQPAQLYR